MNEQLQYAEMIEVPVSTCNITYKPKRKRFFKKDKRNAESVKDKLIDKINAEETAVAEEQEKNTLTESQVETLPDQAEGEKVETATISKKRSKFAIGIVGIQVFAVICLVGVILVTNYLNPNSGINNLIKGSFAMVKTDNREYGEFSLSLPSSAEITVDNGVMTIGSGSVYTPCNGKVSSLIKNADGTFDMELTFSDNFKSVFNGLYYAYANVGEKVYKNVPIGYAKSQVKFCFYDSQGDMITDYSIGNNSIVWA